MLSSWREASRLRVALIVAVPSMRWIVLVAGFLVDLLFLGEVDDIHARDTRRDRDRARPRVLSAVVVPIRVAIIRGRIFGHRFGPRRGVLVLRRLGLGRPPARPALRLLLLLLRLGLGERGLLGQQRLPVSDRDLVVIGVNLREGEKAVAVAAVVDEGRLQRGLDPRDLR